MNIIIRLISYGSCKSVRKRITFRQNKIFITILHILLTFNVLYFRQTSKIAPEEAVGKLRVIFELVEQLLNNKEFDKDFQEELSAAHPNYMNVLQSYKRDLLRNDCGIIIAGMLLYKGIHCFQNFTIYFLDNILLTHYINHIIHFLFIYIVLN